VTHLLLYVRGTWSPDHQRTGLFFSSMHSCSCDYSTFQKGWLIHLYFSIHSSVIFLLSTSVNVSFILLAVEHLCLKTSIQYTVGTYCSDCRKKSFMFKQFDSYYPGTLAKPIRSHRPIYFAINWTKFWKFDPSTKSRQENSNHCWNLLSSDGVMKWYFVKNEVLGLLLSFVVGTHG
jgi:hypothetical protein